MDVPTRGLAVTVLGSGSPFPTPHRVSASYVVWLDGRPRLLMDAGGGAFERLGRAGVAVADLDAVLLTHLHADHCGDLPSVVFAAWMTGRARPLTVVGPAPRDDQPGCRELCDLLFGERGAFRYLRTFEGFGIEALEAASDPEQPDAAGPTTVLDLGDLRVESVPVPHGMMPAVAYRVRAGAASLTFSGDVEGPHVPLQRLARSTGLLLHALPLPERDVPHSHLHAKPTEVGQQAAAADAVALLLTHVMPELDDERDAAESLVRAHYAGPVAWAEDLTTHEVGEDRPS